MQQVSLEAQTALGSFHQYLLDEIPPNRASAAIGVLAGQSPELLTAEIRSWLQTQRRANPVAAIPDYLLHALKKIHLVGELELVDRQSVDRLLDEVLPQAMNLCPPEERDHLERTAASLRRRVSLFHSAPALTVPDSTHANPAGSKNRRGEPSEIDATRQRFSLILRHLTRRGSAIDSRPDLSVLAQLVCLATATATNKEDLREAMRRIPPVFDSREAGNTFQVLGSALPSWDLEGWSSELPHPIRAMKKIISLSSDSVERAKRFRELVMAAVDQFNNGRFAPAVWMLELSERVIREQEIDSTVVSRIQGDAASTLRTDHLSEFVAMPAKHPVLRRALRFFPSLAPAPLLEQLAVERASDRRDALVAVLEVWGTPARGAIVRQLTFDIDREPDVDLHVLLRMIELLRRIPRDGSEAIAEEMDVLGRACTRGESLEMIREAVAAIGTIGTETASRLLSTRLAEFASIPFRKEHSLYTQEELHEILDRIIAALADIATPSALRAIARHGIRKDAALGETRARLAFLSGIDLSADRETVDLLIEAIRAELPSKVFGRLLGGRSYPGLTPLIESLTATRTEPVRALLEQVAKDYAQYDFGQVAASILGRERRSPQPSREGLQGELTQYELPTVVRELVDSGASGLLTLADERQEIRGRLLFGSGRLLTVETRKLHGANALYELLERPVTGSWAFVPRFQSEAWSAIDPIDVENVLVEGLRRHQQMGLLVALVPSGVALERGAARPTRPPREDDPMLLRDVWVRASSGKALSEWEQDVPADSWRIRRILTHWLEEGALQPAG